jgi:hypothetical protein
MPADFSLYPLELDRPVFASGNDLQAETVPVIQTLDFKTEFHRKITAQQFVGGHVQAAVSL